jgi:hypothetical protein
MYKVVCYYRQRPERPEVTIADGLTLEQARTWCRAPEASSETCTKPSCKRRTRLYGDWFYGYTKE